MGTRRSRHNKGRKPLYKEHRFTAAQLIGHPKYPWGDGSGAYYDTHRTWDDDALEKLEVLCEAGVPVETAADVIGRKPSTLVHRAIEVGLSLPDDWRSLVNYYKPKIRQPRDAMLAYPYIIKARPEHSDLLEVNSLIPRGVPSHMRADMVQSIMLGLFEGRVAMDDLRARKDSLSFYIKKFYKENFEANGRAVSLTGAPDEDREYYDIASSLSAKEWFSDRYQERGRYGDAYRAFEPPTQLDAVFEMQIANIHRRRVEAALRVGSTQPLVSIDEVRAEFSN